MDGVVFISDFGDAIWITSWVVVVFLSTVA